MDDNGDKRPVAVFPESLADYAEKRPTELGKQIEEAPQEAPQADRVFLGLESFRKHMSDEGWQLQTGMVATGYQIWGKGFTHDCVDVPEILHRAQPHTVIVQDKREWDPAKPGCFDKTAQFYGCRCLAHHDDIFKMTICKDAHNDPAYHRRAAEEIGCNAWIVYYHPAIVHRLAPWIPVERMIRTYHGLDPAAVPGMFKERNGALLGGFLHEGFYPLRTRIARAALPEVTIVPHPGYHASGSATPAFLQLLAYYKVAICTASVFGYALRKIMEATACGCRVITDLPEMDRLPEIEDNLIRVSSDTKPDEIREIVLWECERYDLDLQLELARRAIRFYDYRAICRRLATEIEDLRTSLQVPYESAAVE